MPVFNADGTFAGLTPEQKAAAVRECLSVDVPVTVRSMVTQTGLTVNQVHAGIRYLREATHCVVTKRQGPASTYKLAEDAPEVRDYVERRMHTWHTQIKVIQLEMARACEMLPDGSVLPVEKCAAHLNWLLDILDMNAKQNSELDRKEREAAQRLERRERSLVRREAKLNDKGQKRVKVPA